MSTRTRSYIFSVALICSLQSAWGQITTGQTPPAQDTTAVDTVAKVKVKVRPEQFIPTGVRVGYDLMTLGKSIYQERFNGWEVAADADFYRFFLVAEYGAWAIHDSLSNGLYENDGHYYRVGVDVNFLKKDTIKNMFFLGGRFGHSSYNDKVTYTYDRSLFPWPGPTTVENPLVIATWVELTTGIKIRLVKFVWLGATARFKFGLDLDGNGPLQSYDVPGFGRNIAATTWGFNYYLLFRIPFRGEAAVVK